MSQGSYDLIDMTWPAASRIEAGGFVIREGRGAGSRVGAASLAVPLEHADIDAAIAAHRAFGQRPIFQIREGQQDLDAALGAKGYEAYDPVEIYGADLSALPQMPQELSAFAHWPPLAITREIFAMDGITEARQAVMARAWNDVAGVATAILGRAGDRPAGAAFVACAGAEAMLHALIVDPAFRRMGVARNIMAEAAHFAAHNGAQRLSLVVRLDNSAAIALYKGLGMQPICRYHYRREFS